MNYGGLSLTNPANESVWQWRTTLQSPCLAGSPIGTRRGSQERKKLLLLFAVVALTLVSCGSKTAKTDSSDSTKVDSTIVVDSTVVDSLVVVDSTTVSK